MSHSQPQDGDIAGSLFIDQTDLTDLGKQITTLIGLPGFIVTVFPTLLQKLLRNPRYARLLSLVMAVLVASGMIMPRLFRLRDAVLSYLMSYVTASVTVYGWDNLYQAVSRFLRSKKMLLTERKKTAQSLDMMRRGGYDTTEFEANEDEKPRNVALFLNDGLQIFRHDGRFWGVTKSGREENGRDGREITIWSLGWSTEPIRHLLEETYDVRKTTIKEVYTEIMVPDEYSTHWVCRACKRQRPLASVNLEQSLKDSLVSDIKEYLAPETEKWYHDRGIPHRRGYLFHGSPGTGKSSLALALAGEFDMEIYMINLLDQTLSDKNLGRLFKQTGSGCLILLEDVDCAGLGRRLSDKKGQVVTAVDRSFSHGLEARVTLSGLLNAIDGVGAPESHILVMTSNCPDTLDEALIRRGRVDLMVPFKRAVKSQAKELFLRLYQKVEPKENGCACGNAASASDRELEALAQRFADEIPDEAVSTAQLQDFILDRKKDPRQAVEDVAKWVEEARKEGEGWKEEDTDEANVDQDEDQEQAAEAGGNGSRFGSIAGLFGRGSS